jgi:integrase/rubredoxin
LEPQVQKAVKCPECQSEKAFKNGTRKIAEGTTAQRYICRVCGYRYTSPSSLNVLDNIHESNQIGAKAKNLVFAQKIKTCADDEKLTVDAKGLITQFWAYLEKEGYDTATQYPGQVKRLATLGANLRNPEEVKTIIGKMKVKQGTKMLYVYAYNALAAMLKIPWDLPTYRQEDIIPHIPDESELDALINGSKSKRMAAYLQCLKETFGDPSEALRIKWIDVNEKEQTIKINYPVKNHLPRTLQVSNKLLAMLNALPKNSEKIFPVNYASMATCYRYLRKRVADVQKNPRILSIELRSFRHWGGTSIAFHTNGNVLLVKKLLGHRHIENSMKYIGLINFKDDQFETATANTVEDILKLGAAGWIEYSVIKIGSNEIHCFKKPKRFSNYA